MRFIFFLIGVSFVCYACKSNKAEIEVSTVEALGLQELIVDGYSFSFHDNSILLDFHNENKLSSMGSNSYICSMELSELPEVKVVSEFSSVQAIVTDNTKPDNFLQSLKVEIKRDGFSNQATLYLYFSKLPVAQ